MQFGRLIFDLFEEATRQSSTIRRSRLKTRRKRPGNRSARLRFESLEDRSLLAAEVNVLGSALVILDGDTTPGVTDGTDFGSVSQGAPGISRTFMVRNDGDAILTLGSLSVPSGFTLTEGLAVSLPPTGSDTFTVRLDTTTVGTKSGQISFANNDSDENPFNFSITGTVGSASAAEVTVLGSVFVIVDGDTTPGTLDDTDFGSVAQGGAGISRTYTVRNDGAGTLTLGSLSVPVGFTVIEGLVGSLPFSGSDTFTVRLDTTTAGVKSGQISFANNDSDENPFNFSITGTVTSSGAAEVSVLGSGLNIVDGDTTPSTNDGTDFGSVAQGAAGISRTFTVRNDGTATLTLSSLSVPVGFTVTDGLVASLAAGASDTITVRLDTAIVGTKSGQISLTNNDSDENPFNFTITGIVTTSSAPEVTVLGSALNIVDGDTTPSTTDGTDFGSVAQGAAGISRTFTVRNDGTATLTLSSLSVPVGFTVTDGLVASLAAGVTDIFTVRLDTAIVGTKSGQISFANNDSNENPFNFTITGIVTTSTAPEIRVLGNNQNIVDGDTTPSTTDGTDFGSVGQGFAGISRTFTVFNDGNATLTLGSLSVPVGFTVTDGLVASLAPGVTDIFTVRLDTAIVGTKSGQISFGNNDSDENPFNFSITGTVTGPEITVIGNSQNIVDGDTTPSVTDGTDFGGVKLGATGISRTFTVRNDGNATLTLGSVSVPAGFTVTEGLVASLAAGASDTITIRLDTATLGTKSGQITFGNNDSNENPFNFSIIGIVAQANMTGYRPQHGPGSYTPFAKTSVAEADEEHTQRGPGIRINGDDDNANGTRDYFETTVAGENDLIEVELSAGGTNYVLARNNPALRVWTSPTKGTEILFTNNETGTLAFPPTGVMSVWVEWSTLAHSTNATLTLKPTTGAPAGLPVDKLVFHTFTSIVVALGGRAQDPVANQAQGTFQIAAGLYGEGYDAYMFNENVVNSTFDRGAGVAYDAIVRAIQKRGVSQVSVFGYSYGGGGTWNLVDRLNRDRPTIGTFTIPFTGYVDAVTADSLGTQELRRPPSSLFHGNYYQRGTFSTDSGLDGGPVPGADFELDVETTTWGLNATHYTIDDLAQVIAGIRGLLVPRVAR